MKNYDVQFHGEDDRLMGQAKQPWVCPSLEVIATESAEGGTHTAQIDGHGGHFTRPRS